MLTNETIQELQLILEEDYKLRVRGADLNEVANNMVRIFDVFDKLDKEILKTHKDDFRNLQQ
jgi:hypothetical protein